MRRSFIFTCVVIISFFASAQKDNKVTIGIIDSLESKLLGEQRKVWINVPNGAYNSNAEQRYPVVYLLDGDYHFASVVGMLEQLSGSMIIPEMIVVGIPNTNRTRDLTPTKGKIDPPYADSTMVSNSGGGEKFISFLEQELMPFIESKYPTAPYRMIIGHSLGGLLVMQSFVHHPNLFNAYVCIDPSMWWDGRNLLNETRKYLNNANLEGKSIYLGIANTLEGEINIHEVEKDTTRGTEHIRAILDLQNTLNNGVENGLRFQGKFYPDDSHPSVAFISEYDALRFIFSFYPLKLAMEDYMGDSNALVSKFKNHYTNISKEMGYEMRPPQQAINMIGYEFLKRKMFSKAESMFQMNVENYPKNYQVYNDYGNYFLAQGDKLKALEQFKKALLIKENPYALKKIKDLSP